MKFLILGFAAMAHLVLLISANPVQKIPLYRRTHHGFRSTKAKELKNGMLGGTVQIGNPPQLFTLAFDTSKGFSWVRTVDCQAENCHHRCALDPRRSTTLIDTQLPFTMHYGKGVVNTTVFLDTFRYGGLTVHQMPFGGAYAMDKFDEGFDGFLGLGRNINLNVSIHYAKRDLPASGFVPNAFQQSAGLQSAQFGMYTTNVVHGFSSSGSLSKDEMQQQKEQPSIQQLSYTPSLSIPSSSTPSSQPIQQQHNQPTKPSSVTSGGIGSLSKRHYKEQEEPAGYLVIGGIDRDAIQGNLFHIPLSANECDDHWAVPVKEAKFEDSFHIDSHAKAILSTSTDVIGLPYQQAQEFKERWYAVYDEQDNTFMIPCCLMQQLTSFKIRLGDIHVVIPPHYWSYPRQVDSCCELCRTHIGKSESDTDFVIGSSFTNAFYTQYDAEQERISLALKKNHHHDGLKVYQA
ncbi:aspartic peptidase domain-containing protein [Gilbertella persicaria]|uniref:aspartic peptidase domain-containing protein n=1 Tax=Gilbertella persicaria TaxID=101096 RepID=UPI00221E3C88|nr:aspartic peptidase domain-containing protein [Gilbertella persicaria]KAI8069846.1 aspartic peptidase domain-containing protein [Gilbertella persicaria]